MAVKYLKAEAHLVTKGPIRHHEVPYDYDYGQKKMKSFSIIMVAFVLVAAPFVRARNG